MFPENFKREVSINKMIDIEKFQEIRLSKHLIILDTNVLLELYRQPANISLDVINAIKEIQSNIYLPNQVYNEYKKHYEKIRGDAKKKYENVTKELSTFLRDLQGNIATKIGEYRRHNYTDICELQKDLDEKIKEARNIIIDFETNHNIEIQRNINFLENDNVKEFVDLLEKNGNIGEKMPFSQKLVFLQEGKIRFDNLIPPGYLDYQKDGEDKYGDLFIWKDIIKIAKEKESNIIFVCNDIKEDWWAKEKDKLIDLRQELNDEFKEINPTLSINFLTLDKFFAYLAEELKLGKSKSALQLSAMDDIGNIINNYYDELYRQIGEYICSLDIEKELDEKFREFGDEEIYWDITDVSVEKENRTILYYVNLDISVLADIVYQEEGDYPYNAGKIAVALIGHIEISMEEYSVNSQLKNISVEKGDILHIEPEIWHVVKSMNNRSSCKEIIIASKRVMEIQDNIQKISKAVDISELKQVLQQYASLYEGLAESIKPMQINESMLEIAKQLSINIKAMGSVIKPIQVNEAVSEFVKQVFPKIKAIESNIPIKSQKKQ